MISHTLLEQQDARRNQKDGPEFPHFPKDRNPEVIQQKQDAQADEEDCAERRIHFQFAQAEPFGGRLAELFGSGGLVGVNDHVEIKSRRSQTEDGAKSSPRPVA